MIETWQADPDGRFGTEFRGFGRCPTNDEGEWEIFTLKPGRVGDGQAPHIDVNVFARGMLNRCVTRIYFADEDNRGDPVLETVPGGRRGTLIVEPGDDGYRFDVHVQGERETVFFGLVFDGVLARGGVAEQVSGRAWLQALLDFEAALARAQARAGMISDDEAEAIAAVVRRRPLRRGRDRRGRGGDRQPGGRRGEGAQGADRRARPPRRDEPGRRRHRRDARRQARAGAAARRPARRGRRRGALAEAHRDTPIMGRTLLQAGAADDVRAQGRGLDGGARRGRRPPAQRRGSPISSAARSARSTPLRARPRASTRRVLPWHTLRGRVGELAGALGVAAGAIGKAARDVMLLARPRSARCASASAAARPRCRTSTTRSPRSPRSAARSRRPAWSPRCWPRWCRSTSAPPARGTPSGRRSASS